MKINYTIKRTQIRRSTELWPMLGKGETKEKKPKKKKKHPKSARRGR